MSVHPFPASLQRRPTALPDVAEALRRAAIPVDKPLRDLETLIAAEEPDAEAIVKKLRQICSITTGNDDQINARILEDCKKLSKLHEESPRAALLGMLEALKAVPADTKLAAGLVHTWRDMLSDNSTETRASLSDVAHYAFKSSPNPAVRTIAAEHLTSDDVFSITYLKRPNQTSARTLLQSLLEHAAATQDDTLELVVEEKMQALNTQLPAKARGHDAGPA